MSFLSNLFRPVALHADHGPEDLRDAEPVRPSAGGALRVVGGGWLEENGGRVRLVTIPTKRTQALIHGEIDGIVWHWTATARGTGKSCAKQISAPPGQGDRAASFHMAIEYDGVVYQCAPLSLGTWNAGGATAMRFVWNNGRWIPAPRGHLHAVSANSWALGIELVNVGEVRLVNGRWYGWPFQPGHAPEVPEVQVLRVGKLHYQAYTLEQEQSALEIVRAARLFNPKLTREACSWTHSTIDPTRKIDPGPVWSGTILPRILDAAFGAL